MRYGDAAATNDYKTLLAASPAAKSIKMADGRIVSGSRRLANATTVVEEFLAAGLPLSLGLAAVANAHAESALDNLAMGDFSDSDGQYHAAGLFQIQDLKGKRTFAGDRTDPTYATHWIIEELHAHENDTEQTESSTKQKVRAESIRSALERNASPAELAGLFAVHVERPRYLLQKQAERQDIARRFFPSVADLPSDEVSRRLGISEKQPESSSWSPLSLLPSIPSVSSLFEAAPEPTTASFSVADGGDYTLVDERGRAYGPGEVPPGMYTVSYQGRPLRLKNNQPLRLNAIAGNRYEAQAYSIRQV